MRTPEEREKVARDRAAAYAAAPLSALLLEAAGHADCRCRYPDGNGPMCGREQLATELRARAAGQQVIERENRKEGSER